MKRAILKFNRAFICFITVVAASCSLKALFEPGNARTLPVAIEDYKKRANDALISLQELYKAFDREAKEKVIDLSVSEQEALYKFARGSIFNAIDELEGLYELLEDFIDDKGRVKEAPEEKVHTHVIAGSQVSHKSSKLRKMRVK